MLYTGGPRPYGYEGLGEVFVFLFFGIVAVAGSYFVQVKHLDWEAFALAVPVGLLAAAILVVNNVRDIDTDRRAGKRTLAVRLGRERTRTMFAAIVYLAYLLAPVTWIFGPLTAWTLLPWLTLPVAAARCATVRNRTDGPSLNRMLARTGMLELGFCMLLAAGLLLEREGRARRHEARLRAPFVSARGSHDSFARATGADRGRRGRGPRRGCRARGRAPAGPSAIEDCREELLGLRWCTDRSAVVRVCLRRGAPRGARGGRPRALGPRPGAPGEPVWRLLGLPSPARSGSTRRSPHGIAPAASAGRPRGGGLPLPQGQGRTWRRRGAYEVVTL